MVIQKTAVYKVLAIVLALVLLVGSSERVEAADGVKSGTFEVDGKEYIYCYVSSFEETFSNGYVKKFTVDNPCYALCFLEDTGNMRTHIFSYTSNTVRWTEGGSNKSISFYNKNGIYYYIMDSVKSYNLPSSANIGNSSVLLDAFINYMKSADFDDLLFTPDWHATGSDPIYQINDLQADIVDGNIIVTWEPQLYLPYKLMDHLYIRFAYAARTPGTVTTTAGRNRYLDIDAYAKMSDCGITIPLTDLTLLGDRYVSSLLATPYYYVGDNLENETKKGQNTLVYFDELGVSSAPIIVDPEVKEEIPVENVEQNIFSVITNFFGGFFRNLLNTIKTAIIPESADLLALLQEMNDWFSERFGFIWYPFDLAIDIVAAFALGEPDSKITVPEFTINILGGIKLWDAFVVDLDPIDFLKYVRFFTSTIMCCGTVSLAIRKWDEWIGGEH